jgi:hypothetical protein
MPKEDQHFWDETRKPWMDLENERRAVKPQKSGKSHSRANENTGKASQMMAGFFQEMVMQEVLKDAEGLQERDMQITEEADGCNFDANAALRGDADDSQASSEIVDQDAADDLEVIRRRRLAELMRHSSNKNKFLALGHGRYSEIQETEFLKTVTESPRAIVHFFHKEFKRCQILDDHLAKLTPVLLGCRVVKLNAEKAPFFVGKLKIKVLPTTVFFINGVAVHRIVGFEGLDGTEQFSTASFVRVLESEKMLVDSDEAAVNQLADDAGNTVRKEEDFDEELGF